MKIKRYNIAIASTDGEMVENEIGEYVKYLYFISIIKQIVTQRIDFDKTVLDYIMDNNRYLGVKVADMINEQKG